MSETPYPADASAAATEAFRPHVAAAATLFGLIALAGVFTAYSAVKDFAYARASGAWRQVEGVVLSPPRGGEGEIRYAYYVGGESFEGRRIAFRTRGYIGSPPPRTPGARVAVYVAPNDPQTAVLVPGGSGRRFAVWLILGGGIVFIGVAGLARAVMALDFPQFDPGFARCGDEDDIDVEARPPVYSSAE